MKKTPFVLLLLCCFLSIVVSAQNVPLGMNYQAVARDAYGAPLAKSVIHVKISFTSADEQAKRFYTETQQITTDDLGLFEVIIGQGLKQNKNKGLQDVPWEKERIWMLVEMSKDANQDFQVVSNTQVLSVPYAMHAQKTFSIDSIDQVEERNQSIRWLTSGNLKSRPEAHYLGTREGTNLAFKTDNTTRLTIKPSGQSVVSSPFSMATDTEKNKYPVLVTGSNQGMWIRINDDRDNTNNFLTFKDKDGIQGRVEGENEADFRSSSDFVRTTALFITGAVILGGKVASAIIRAAGFAVSIFGAGGAPVSAAAAAGFILDGVGLGLNYGAWLGDKLANLGVSFQSGSGDFAEYLIRHADVRDLLPGEVVGVRGGVVSLNTIDADHIMVVSTAPIVLGNTPLDGNDEGYEKVAFMGQVPVKIAGPAAIGDYIIASGNQDGFGIAINPKAMLPGDFSRVVGVAWEAKENNPLNYVNVAIGINTNDLANKTAQLNWQADNITNYLQGKGTLARTPDEIPDLKDLQVNLPKTNIKKGFSDEYFDAFVEENEKLLTHLMGKALTNMEGQGLDLSKNPEAQKLLADPIAYLKELRRMPGYQSQWAVLDQSLKDALENE